MQRPQRPIYSVLGLGYVSFLRPSTENDVYTQGSYEKEP